MPKNISVQNTFLSARISVEIPKIAEEFLAFEQETPRITGCVGETLTKKR